MTSKLDIAIKQEIAINEMRNEIRKKAFKKYGER